MDRQIIRQTIKQMDRHLDRWADRQIDQEIDARTYESTAGQTHSKIKRRTYTGNQITNKQTVAQTDWQKKPSHTYIPTDRHRFTICNSLDTSSVLKNEWSCLVASDCTVSVAEQVTEDGTTCIMQVVQVNRAGSECAVFALFSRVKWAILRKLAADPRGNLLDFPRQTDADGHRRCSANRLKMTPS